MTNSGLEKSKPYDTVIIGGGPAGISAAMQLGFHKRKVIIIDRLSSSMNFHTNPVNNYPGIQPNNKGTQILNKLREELIDLKVPTHAGNVVKVNGAYPEFKIQIEPLKRTENNQTKTITAKTLLFATGISRKHPRVNGDWRNWLPYAAKNEISYYCPECEGPLTAGKDILIIGAGTARNALYIAECIRPYAEKIRVFMTKDGYIPLKKADWELLDKSHYEWSSGTIQRVNIEKPKEKQQILTISGETIECEQFFVSWTDVPRSQLASEIGVEVDQHGNIVTDIKGKTSIIGIWSAGDVRPITQSVAMAAGTGNYAGIMINKFLR